jgi:hypothetical protein
LWDYQRGVWQYDVICAIIVAFIFLSPPRWFRDQPRVPNVAEITSPTAHPGESAFYVGEEVVDSVPDEQRLVEVSKVLTAQRRRKIAVTRIEPIYNADQEVTGYIAYAKQ